MLETVMVNDGLCMSAERILLVGQTPKSKLLRCVQCQLFGQDTGRVRHVRKLNGKDCNRHSMFTLLASDTEVSTDALTEQRAQRPSLLCIHFHQIDLHTGEGDACL